MPCSGSVNCNEYEGNGESLCYECGCDWEMGSCFGDPTSCSSHSSQFDCENCLCDWSEPSLNMKINISGSWRDAEEIKIDIGGSWRTVTKVQINIGNVWRTIFG